LLFPVVSDTESLDIQQWIHRLTAFPPMCSAASLPLVPEQSEWVAAQVQVPVEPVSVELVPVEPVPVEPVPVESVLVVPVLDDAPPNAHLLESLVSTAVYRLPPSLSSLDSMSLRSNLYSSS
jgi:hypothetical protein